MKHVLIASLLATVLASSGYCQDRIYRCGNEYTNTVPSPQTKGCKLLEGGNVTVVQGTRTAALVAAVAPVASAGQRVDAAEQKARDADAVQILESELKKVQERQLELQKEYNNGEPEKRADELRNPQKYVDRLAALKASLARNEADMAGIRRELGRASSTSATR
ncbi:MAG: hypothetical protein NTX31_12115 [Burkholderiales bacterium]|nr:hypothetical protein [Burkholderiales bacterium]